jgi:hypothetical protein
MAPFPLDFSPSDCLTASSFAVDLLFLFSRQPSLCQHKFHLERLLLDLFRKKMAFGWKHMGALIYD